MTHGLLQDHTSYVSTDSTFGMRVPRVCVVPLDSQYYTLKPLVRLNTTTFTLFQDYSQ